MIFRWWKVGREAPSADPHRVVVVGGGFGGVYAVKALKNVPVSITLLDRRNFHLFQPLLYQVATGSLSPANIAEPLRSLFERRRDVEVLLGDVHDVDPGEKRLTLATGEVISYDTLLVACGATSSYFGNEGWAEHAPPLKSVEDATEMRRKIYSAFERAERTDDPQLRLALMTFVIVGGGPTGTELAGAVAEIARITLKKEFRRIDPSDANVILVQSRDRVLNSFSEKSSAAAEASLKRLGVVVRTGCRVTGVSDSDVVLKTENGPETIPCHTTLWAAGVRAEPLTEQLARRTGIELARGGRIPVEPDLTLAGHPNIFVVGDAAALEDSDGNPLPGVAQVAIQQGKYAARLIAARVGSRDTSTIGPFQYSDLGSMATIGKREAVAEAFGWKMSGRIAWFAWLFVHLMNIIPFHSRFLVLMQWSWTYFTNERPARLITDTAALVAKMDRDATASQASDV